MNTKLIEKIIGALVCLVLNVQWGISAERFSICEGKPSEPVRCADDVTALMSPLFNSNIERCIPLSDKGYLVFGKFTRFMAKPNNSNMVIDESGNIKMRAISETKSVEEGPVFPLRTEWGTFHLVQTKNPQQACIEQPDNVADMYCSLVLRDEEGKDYQHFKPLRYGDTNNFVKLYPSSRNTFYILQYYNGNFSQHYTFSRNFSDGTKDESFADVYISGHSHAVVLKDESLIVAGSFPYADKPEPVFLRRYSPKGQLDKKFQENLGAGLGSLPTNMFIDRNGSVILEGVKLIGGTPLNGWAKIKRDFSLDRRYLRNSSKMYPGSTYEFCQDDPRMKIDEIAQCNGNTEIIGSCWTGDDCCGSGTQHHVILSGSGEVINFETRRFSPEE